MPSSQKIKWGLLTARRVKTGVFNNQTGSK